MLLLHELRKMLGYHAWNPIPRACAPYASTATPRMQGDAKRAEGRFRKRRGAHLAMQTNLRLPVNRETPGKRFEIWVLRRRRGEKVWLRST